MSYEYRQWILPEPSKMNYLPPPELLPTVVADMERLGWLVSPLPELRTRYPVAGKPESRRAAAKELGTVADEVLKASGALLVELPVAEGSNQDPTDTIGPGQCYAAGLMLSRDLWVVPSDGAQDGRLVCPGCGGNLSDQLEPAGLMSIWQPFWGAHRLETTECPHCHGEVPSVNIWHHANDGALRPKDQAPFFRFAIRLDDAARESEPGSVDAELTSALRANTGVHFRFCGRWT